MTRHAAALTRIAGWRANATWLSRLDQPHGRDRAGGYAGILPSGLRRWLASAEESDRVGNERIGLLRGSVQR